MPWHELFMAVFWLVSFIAVVLSPAAVAYLIWRLVKTSRETDG